ncbi:MAG: transketolase family protein [Dehalococcoidales bacterium]|jgi:transketolase|nr:transketolase family protein [Dehalococcoidales bacterium]
MAEELAMREVYGKTLAELGAENPDIVVLDADLSASTQTKFFADKFPERFFDCGIAEQNMVTIAAGLASAGKIPFASTFAVFAPGRCFDQVRVSISQAKMNVKLVSTHSGLSVGEDGATHQAIEDLALATSLLNFTVLVPADGVETAQAVRAAAALQGPVYIRLPRLKSPVFYDKRYKFKIGKASQLRAGNDVTIFAIGIMVGEALTAAQNLAKKGIDARVINMSTLKPIDETIIRRAAVETGAVVTVEEHIENGGLGSAVARVIAKDIPVPIEFVAVQSYAESGPPADLLKKYGLTAPSIEKAVKKVLKRK